MKSKLLICLIILCIFSISTVSAADNQTELISDSSDTSLSVSNQNFVISVSTDYHSFSELNQSISQSSVELNLEHDYKYDGGVINVSKENKFTINGNSHIIDGLNGNPLIFDSKDIIVINNLTFQNAVNASLSVKSPVIFNNVTFINITNYKYESTIMGQDSIQFDECFFENVESSEYALISCSRGNIVFKNSICREGKFNQGFIVGEHNDGMSIENCTFENLSSHIGSAIDDKGCRFTV